jgi:hypothetical protein
MKEYPFIVTARLVRYGTVKEIEVRVYDPEDPGPTPLPIAEGSAPAYGSDGLATAVFRAFSELEIPPTEPTHKEIDDLIKEIEEARGE